MTNMKHTDTMYIPLGKHTTVGDASKSINVDNHKYPHHTTSYTVKNINNNVSTDDRNIYV